MPRGISGRCAVPRATALDDAALDDAALDDGASRSTGKQRR
jgi:hypothetical protein